jgi:hypothetical protein
MNDPNREGVWLPPEKRIQLFSCQPLLSEHQIFHRNRLPRFEF